MYCRSWSVMRSKTCCDCCNKSELLICVSAVESVEYPVDASIIRWMVDACVGVGGNRALRPLPIFLFTKIKAEIYNFIRFFVLQFSFISMCTQTFYQQILIIFYNDFKIKTPLRVYNSHNEISWLFNKYKQINSSRIHTSTFHLLACVCQAQLESFLFWLLIPN